LNAIIHKTFSAVHSYRLHDEKDHPFCGLCGAIVFGFAGDGGCATGQLIHSG
jgi:hypothetical protein